MASKNEYYQKIIVALQSDISSSKSEIVELKSIIARQQKEIEALKSSQGAPQKSSGPQSVRIDMNALRSEVKRVCDKAILANYEHLPTVFANKHEFENFRKSAETKFLSATAFTAYKKSQETRLKSIEEKLGSRFCLLAINVYGHHRDKESKSILSVFRNLKNIEFEGLSPFIVFLLTCALAVFLICSIN